MKKVYQEIVCKDKGDCMRAAIASLFDLNLWEVPNFIKEAANSEGDNANANWLLIKWLSEKGYEHPTYINKIEGHATRNTEYLKRVAKHDGGTNGYFYASVPSQTFEYVSHAVIVDLDLNIVHDPNPNQKALALKPEDVIDIMTFTDFLIREDGSFTSRKELWKDE